LKSEQYTQKIKLIIESDRKTLSKTTKSK